MNAELLIDTINIITEKSQSSIEQLIRKDKPIYQKLKFVSLYLNEMKSQILQWICNILNINLSPKDLLKKLFQLKKSTDEQLAKNRLHIVLKKKLKKLKKQSFMHSVDSQHNFFNQENKIQDLEKSVLQIQKDLNIEPDQEDSLAISSIIQKSRMLNFDHSTVKDEHNVSVMSEIQTFSLSLSDKTDKKDNNQAKTIIQPSNYVVDSVLSKLQHTQSLTKETSGNQYRTKLKQNEERNIPQQIQAQIRQKEEVQELKGKLAQGAKLIMKKKKKSVYSTKGQVGNMSRDDLLGNILEECLQGENK